MDKYILLAIIGVSVIALVLGCVIKKPDIILSFILRIVIGFIGIYFLNSIFTNQGINSTVGINGISTITLGILGTPGFILLYALSIYFEWIR